MKQRKVGKIKNIELKEETQELEVTIVVTDPKFKKKLLRDLSLSGNLVVEGNNVIYKPNEEES